MAQLQPSLGGYDYRSMIEVMGSFLVNGSSAPDGIRDGATNQISVARDSAGLFTVTIAGDFALPTRMVAEFASLNPVDATPVLVCACGIVEGSYSAVTRSFKILCTKVGDVGASAYFDPAPADPDDNSRISFLLKGSLSTAGHDAA